MNRIDKKGVKRQLNINYIYKADGTPLKIILKEGYMCYLRNLKIKEK